MNEVGSRIIFQDLLHIHTACQGTAFGINSHIQTDNQGTQVKASSDSSHEWPRMSFHDTGNFECTKSVVWMPFGRSCCVTGYKCDAGYVHISYKALCRTSGAINESCQLMLSSTIPRQAVKHALWSPRTAPGESRRVLVRKSVGTHNTG